MKLLRYLVLNCKASRRTHNGKMVDPLNILPVFSTLERTTRSEFLVFRTYLSDAWSMGLIFVETLSTDEQYFSEHVVRVLLRSLFHFGPALKNPLLLHYFHRCHLLPIVVLLQLVVTCLRYFQHIERIVSRQILSLVV